MVTRTYIAQNGLGQIHTWGFGLENSINHWDNIGFSNITQFSHGHHMRGGGGNDDFNFRDQDEVDHTIVGRIEDFDYSRDEIRLDGTLLDFANLPSNVRVVEYNGEHNDSGQTPQQWLLIDTGSGNIFYSLEGARVDMDGNGGANGGDNEFHFIQSAPNFSNLVDVDFIDQVNIVPSGYSPSGGSTINDTDENAGDVTATINGSSNGDVIAAGLNNDTVNASGGNDVVWGGSGHDYVLGGDGNDDIYGGTGNDVLSGGTGADTISGDDGGDTVIGNSGDDVLSGGAWGDEIHGNDGADFINGGYGHDTYNGGAGADRFYHQGVSGHGTDWIQDFTDSQGDRLMFGGSASVNDFTVNFANTSGAGSASVNEAFVVYQPTGQILWALVDGANQSSIDLLLGGQTYDLL